ncbi:MAG TPA: calcium-binding protein [Azospirillaceae bacterium]|nr:calcium-binding protein [Azospirillaceae bacterium]
MTGVERNTGTGNDSLTTTSGHDLIRTNAGNDTINASGGNDWISGGGGNDSVRSGSGHDFAQGGDGNDRIFGEDGNDILDGGNGADSVDGGNGDDWAFAWTGNDTVQGGAGHDTMDGAAGSDVLYGGAGNDVLFAGDNAGGTETDKLYGGSGDNVFFNYGVNYGQLTNDGTSWDGQATLQQFRDWVMVHGRGPSAVTQFHLQGRNDTVHDNGPGFQTDTLYYYGKGSATVYDFGGADSEVEGGGGVQGSSDKLVFVNLFIKGNKVDNFNEFLARIRDGSIKYSREDYGDDAWDYNGSGMFWDSRDTITLDFGPAADGTPRILKLVGTTVSGGEGIASFSPEDWIFI